MEKNQTINSWGWMSEVRCDHVKCKEDFQWTCQSKKTCWHVRSMKCSSWYEKCLQIWDDAKNIIQD
jgi:hypothetical protein